MTDAPAAPPPADLSSFLPSDTGDLHVVIPGTNKPMGWVITLAGPGHAKTIALNNEGSRKRLHRQSEIERAQVNGKKWRVEEQTPEESTRDFVAGLVARIVTWTPIKLGSETIEFSESAAIDLLLRPEMGHYVGQIVDYLVGERAFMKGSANS